MQTPNTTIQGQVETLSHPAISSESSDADDVEHHLKQITDYTVHFESLNLQDDWISSYQQVHDEIQAKIDNVENDCLSKSLRDPVLVCFELRARVTTQKTYLDEKAANFRRNQ